MTLKHNFIGKMICGVIGGIEERETRRLHPPLSIAVFTIVFLEIHLFQDGNGRLSRILTALLLFTGGVCFCALQFTEKRH